MTDRFHIPRIEDHEMNRILRREAKRAYAPHISKPSRRPHRGGCGHPDLPVSRKPIAWGSILLWTCAAVGVVVGVYKLTNAAIWFFQGL